MGVTNVLEEDGGVGPITVKNTAITTALKSLAEIKETLDIDHKHNLQVVDTMCYNWRSQVGQSASAFYYASMSLIAYSGYSSSIVGRAKQTMKDFSDDMEIIDQDLEAMNFLSPPASDEGE